MLKKFLLFCMTMFCFSLRAEDKIIDTTNIVSADNIKQSQKNTLSYSFTVPQKDIIEDDMATSEELETFEKIALINEKRALELSMYYQGWGKKECFYALDDVKSTSPIRYSYVKNSELTRQIKMRDFDKAIKFAEIAFEKERIKNPKKTTRYEIIELNIMKLYMLRGNAFAKETYDFFVENIVIYDFEKDGKLYDVDLYRKFDGPVGWSFYYSVLYVYFYFKGFGVEKDVQFAKDILHNINKYEDWRKFYVPKYFIKDFDFVKFLMKESFGTINGNHFLYLIYSGKFNEEEKNETLANEHFNIYEENLNSCIKRNTIDELDRIKNLINHPRYSETSYNRILMRFYLRKYVFYSFFYDGVFLAPNPYYNIELAKNI